MPTVLEPRIRLAPWTGESVFAALGSITHRMMSIEKAPLPY
jgi:hypothetical protein